MFHVIAHKSSRPDQGSSVAIVVGASGLTLIQAAGDDLLEPDNIGVEPAEIPVVPGPVQEKDYSFHWKTSSAHVRHICLEISGRV